ncbi:TIGR03620 family F420-dependent LLM class oxidoreductase [Actinospongicola halichondriae]|uniref:TIGR03620 family F420-dependent LLM class oxidoreductase n=1 Tax=Actinospongicola halichondriae TaxID=3236844 RepID=UPI003D47724F
MTAIEQKIGNRGIWWFTEGMTTDEAAAFAQRLEAMGYGALWIPETLGRDPFAHAAMLLDRTEDLVVATGIANIFHRHPGAMLQAQNTLAEQSGGRFLLGLGVSHAPIVAGVRKLDYSKPLTQMRDYLTGMKESAFMAVGPAEPPKTVLAALGPKMLELAASDADGAHPYWTTPEHTVLAKAALGPDKMLCVEQKVVLTTDPTEARDAARAALAMYIGLPNYYKNWLRLGYTEDDLADGGSDRLVDGLVAWGTAAQIEQRLQAHVDAGATHLAIQALNPGGGGTTPDFAALEALAPA